MFTESQTSMLRALSQVPGTEFTMSELAGVADRKPGVVQRGLNALVAAGYIRERRRGNLRLLRYNDTHPLQEEIRRIVSYQGDALPHDSYLRFASASTREASRIAEPPGHYEVAARRILIIAGPNGAGKTTFAKEYLQNEGNCHRFVNADYIAHGLSPFAPGMVGIRAGRLMLQELDTHIAHGHSVAFETTLGGRRYARLIPLWREQGYAVKLIFLSLPSADLAIARVQTRVQQGGHSIPETTIERRYATGRRNFDLLYKPLVDTWVLYDSSGPRPVLLEEGEK